MNVSTKWFENRIEFKLEFQDENPIILKFYKSDENIFTDERDGCNGSAKWFFFVPDNDCDEDGLLFLSQWFRESTYMNVVKTLNLCEGTSPSMPGQSFRKEDLWHYWNNVLIIVIRAAMDI